MVIDFILFVKLVTISTLWCVGIYMNARQRGDAFYFLKEIVPEHSPKIIAKPLIWCINCMASLHSAIIIAIYWFLASLLPPRDLEDYVKIFLLWLCVAIATAGTNGILYIFYLALERFIPPYELYPGAKQRTMTKDDFLQTIRDAVDEAGDELTPDELKEALSDALLELKTTLDELQDDEDDEP